MQKHPKSCVPTTAPDATSPNVHDAVLLSFVDQRVHASFCGGKRRHATKRTSISTHDPRITAGGKPAFVRAPGVRAASDVIGLRGCRPRHARARCRCRRACLTLAARSATGTFCVRRTQYSVRLRQMSCASESERERERRRRGATTSDTACEPSGGVRARVLSALLVSSAASSSACPPACRCAAPARACWH